MSDHYHYDYAEARHDHPEYANERHDHDGDYAGRYHDHAGLESLIRGLREDLSRAEERVRELEEKHDDDIRRLWAHIGNMPGGV